MNRRRLATKLRQHWPLPDVACAEADIADIAVVEASFGCSCSGVDL